MNNPALDALTLDQLRLFVCIADEGSFSAAARKLKRAQSAVSYGLANLEQLLDVQLFDRGGRTPVLTEGGVALLPLARLTMAQAGRLIARAAVVANGVEPDLRIAVDAICPAEVLVEIGRGFQRQFPTVSLRLETEVLEAVPALVASGGCHVGLAGPVGSDAPGLERRMLGYVTLVPVAAPEHPLSAIAAPITAARAAEEVQIVISQRGPASPSSEGVVSHATWCVADASTKLALIRAGLGWGNLPQAMVDHDLAAGRLRRLELDERGAHPWQVPLCSIVAAHAPPGPAGQWLLGELESMCRRGGLVPMTAGDEATRP